MSQAKDATHKMQVFYIKIFTDGKFTIQHNETI